MSRHPHFPLDRRRFLAGSAGLAGLGLGMPGWARGKMHHGGGAYAHGVLSGERLTMTVEDAVYATGGRPARR